MEPYKKRLHLDKTEMIFLFGLVFLISSLMFTFGILMGFGLKPTEVKTVEELAHSEKTGNSHDVHSRSPAAETEKSPLETGETDSEKIAKKEGPVKKTTGNKLKDDYYDSKQRALVDMALRESPGGDPRSILDTKAHLAANTQWKREIASESGPEKKDEVDNSTEETAKDVSMGVRELFERSPTSAEIFVPTPGSFTVQIASYATKDESRAKIIELRKANFNEAYVQEVKLKNGEVWWRVAVGSYPGAAWAKKAGETLKRRKLAVDFVIREVN